jgi:phosphoribosyl-ATP pyrophosphohydrolase/phosphoribosyl-AMP cyclohydrolase/histidinol dehydrogenase
VTAAKQLVSGQVAIDMLAGPSELVVLADSSAHPAVIAADLLAQAEHDVLAVPILVTDDRLVAETTVQELDARLADLPTREVAEQALARGAVVLVGSLDEAVEVCDRLAPEHLQVVAENPRSLLDRLSHFGAAFLGEASAEVFGDYGAGPNHTLPTGGTARSFAGLSVFTFLRVQTYLDLSDPTPLVEDTAMIARMEGLEAHARAAEARITLKKTTP